MVLAYDLGIASALSAYPSLFLHDLSPPAHLSPFEHHRNHQHFISLQERNDDLQFVAVRRLSFDLVAPFLKSNIKLWFVIDDALSQHVLGILRIDSALPASNLKMRMVFDNARLQTLAKNFERIRLAQSVDHLNVIIYHVDQEARISEADDNRNPMPRSLAVEEASASTPAFPDQDDRRLPQIARALRNPNFRLFWSGNFLSNIGTWMQNVAQAWLVYRLTQSSVLLGLVGFIGQFPVFLLAPVGGLAADRWRRHRIIVGTQAAMMLLAFALAHGVANLIYGVRPDDPIIFAGITAAIAAIAIGSSWLPARRAARSDPMAALRDL